MPHWDMPRLPLFSLILLLLPATPLAGSIFDDWAPGWTERLGLSFSNGCEEYRGLESLFAWASHFLGGATPSASGHCETKEVSCPGEAPVTGLRVRCGVCHHHFACAPHRTGISSALCTARSGHVKKSGNRELYDFKLRCASRWMPRFLGLRFDVREDLAEAAGVCPDGGAITGVQVMRGRSERGLGGGARDYFNFKLRCESGKWLAPLRLPFDSLKETRSATCPRGRAVTGVRVHRGFRDWGDVDTYEFQLLCLPPTTAHADGGGGDGGGGGSKLHSSRLQARAAAASGADGPAADGGSGEGGLGLVDGLSRGLSGLSGLTRAVFDTIAEGWDAEAWGAGYWGAGQGEL